MEEINNIIYKGNSLFKINSKYILKQIFDNIKQNKLLDIIRYNKKLKRKLNKKKDDYITEYSKIVIEIIPIENSYVHFINIPDKYKPYFHIYFNDDYIKEIKRDYFNESDKVSKIKIIIDYKVKSLFKLFKYCYNIRIINFTKFNINNITNMSYMFCRCSSLERINFFNINTDKVTNMNSLFSGCSSLKELNLSNFNTENVKDMRFMFWGCSSLKMLDISNFNTNNLNNIRCMFSCCSSLKELNISNFNKIKDMSHMFSLDSSIKIKCSEELKNLIRYKYPNISFLSETVLPVKARSFSLSSAYQPYIFPPIWKKIN